MKKLILLTIALVVAVAANAQIQRTFFGLTLGQSTKQQVRTTLAKKGYKCHTMQGDDALFIQPSSLQFGGLSWDMALFRFYKGKLLSVSFSIADNFSGIASETYKVLKAKIDQKYSDFYFSKNEIATYYLDEKTVIILQNLYLNFKLNVTISYSDKDLQDQLLKASDDEL